MPPSRARWATSPPAGPGLELLGPAERAELVSTPAMLQQLARIDGAWVEANRAATLDRWNRWLAS